jgi:hypothetical protein
MTKVVLRDIVTEADREAVMGLRRGPGQDRFVASVEQSFRDAIDDARACPQMWSVNDGDRVVRLYADGRKNRGSTGIEKKTRWDADKLVTESKVATSFGTAVRITETWALVDSPASPSGAEGTEVSPAEGRRLAITTRLEGGPFEKTVVIRRLYARSGRT